MSLKVWLPLNGDLKNLGSGEVNVTSGSQIYKTGGKTSEKAISVNTKTQFYCEALKDLKEFSVTFWTKIESNSSLSTNWGDIFVLNDKTSSGTNGSNLRWETCYSSGYYQDYGLAISNNSVYAITEGLNFEMYHEKNTWHHIGLTCSSNVIIVYLDGVEIRRTTDIKGGSLTGYFIIGDTNYTDGMVNDVRIYDEVISPELIRHLSRQPHEKELKVWLPLNGDLRNQGTADVTVTNSGATVDNSGKMGKCYYLNANKLSFTNPRVGDWNKFTVCGWVKLADGYTANNGFHLFIFGATYYRICISKDGAAVRVLLSDGSTNSGGSSAMLASAISASVWNHYAVSFDNGKVSIYINGILDNSYTVSFTSVRFVNATLDIGTYSSETCKGSINDFRLYSYALSPEEIKKISQGLALHYMLSGIGGENLITTNSMAPISGTNGWSQAGNGWTNSNVVSEGASSGHAIRCTYSGTSQVQGGIHHPTGIAKENFINGATYTLSARIRASKPCVATFYNELMTANKGINLTTDWKIYTHSYVIDNSRTYYSNVIYIRAADVTQNMWVECDWIKLEEGSKATPWQPNPADSTYSLMGLDNDIEYDISGFNNNGTKSPVVITNTDSPRYETSYGTSNNSYFVNGGKISNILCQETPEYTVNLWCYKDDWTDNASELFSCAEGGGFAFDTTTSGFRAWSNVYTNADKSSYSYIAYTQTHTLSSGWHMFTLVDDLTGTKVYIDGVLIRTAASTNYGLHLNVNANLYIGAESTGSSYTSPYLNGRVSDFRIYTTALSASDVQALYNLGEV